MGELVFCSICLMSVGVRLVCSLLMLLHITLAILPFLTSNIGTVSNFCQFVFCSNTSDYNSTNVKDPLPVVSVSCNLISGLCVPYCMVTNLIQLSPLESTEVQHMLLSSPRVLCQPVVLEQHVPLSVQDVLAIYLKSNVISFLK